jgi:hypothetical protein
MAECKLVPTDDGRCRCVVCGHAKPRGPKGCDRVHPVCHPEHALTPEQIARDVVSPSEAKIPRPAPKPLTKEEKRVRAAIWVALPGSQLQRIITIRLGQEAVAGCGCRSMIAHMNQWGPVGCRNQLDVITERLVEIATKREWVLEAEDGCNPEDYGKPVPQTRRTRFLRLLARAVAVTDTGKGFVRGRCQAMALLAIRRSERELEKLKDFLPPQMQAQLASG